MPRSPIDRAVACCVLLALAMLLAASPWVGRGLRELVDPPRRVARAKAPVPRKAVPKPPAVWVEAASVGKPYGDKVKGLLTFRGNPTRSFYGTGPLPRKTAPKVLWRYPEAPMCATSRDRGQNFLWCGTGWTGQPAVFEKDGRTWVVFGAYDRKVHFVDAADGRRILPSFATGDIIKGSVTIDPDGYPIVYSGSRDGHYRAIAFDGARPRELWRLSAGAVRPTMWNDDWDGSGLVLKDHLFIGGENSQMHIARLNRGYDAKGRVTARPRLIFNTPGWDAEQLARLGDRNVSIEGSPTILGNRIFFANSGGLAQGWSIAGLLRGVVPTREFRFWTGDDTDASIVADERGALYLGAEWERGNSRARHVGQMMKLVPGRAQPLAWSRKDIQGRKSGVWATPALYRDLLIVATHAGRLLGLDRDTAEVRWDLPLEGKTWSSPVVVDGVLLQGDCSGKLRAYDVTRTREPPRPLWTVRLPGCIESTPAVWGGRIYVGTRAGFLYAIGRDR